MHWIISVPVWGGPYVERFLGAALPSIRRAIAGLPHRFVIHTDMAGRAAIEPAMAGVEVEFRNIPMPTTWPGDEHGRYQAAARDAFMSAKSGERVALLTADIVVSRETFRACEARFAEGKALVISAGSRTTGPWPKPGMASADLLDWSMHNAHPITRDCYYGTGHCSIPWAVYFHGEQGDVTLRGFHLHPVAAVRQDKPMQWRGSPDVDLIDNYAPEHIHVVTEPDELALVELSAPDRRFRLLPQPIQVPDIVRWAQGAATARHRWLATHRIIIRGKGRTHDDAVFGPVLRELGERVAA